MEIVTPMRRPSVPNVTADGEHPMSSWEADFKILVQGNALTAGDVIL